MGKRCLISFVLFLILIFNCIQVNAFNIAESSIAEKPKNVATGTDESVPANALAENSSEAEENAEEKANSNTENSAQELESEEYIINESDKIIYRVIPETQVDTFKNNFTTPNILAVYSEKECVNEVTSGIIATGMYAKNLSDGNVYEISTIGDFDGDGKIGQVELTNLIRHVVGLKDYQLTGSVLKSADMNNDNNINIIDITILIRYVVYGELDIPENQKIASPTIEVVSGTEGNNDWYTSNVEIKIKPNAESEIIGKTTYKIFGSKEVEETEIAENETITLEQGTYLISAYTYSKSGFKSLATRKTIQIDTTSPEIGKLEMWLDEENGTEYTENTWTTHNVVLGVEDGSDNESGHYETVFYVDDGNKNTQITLSENGTYTITPETSDVAGNKVTSKHTVKIDKNAIPSPTINVVSGEKNEGSDWYKSDSVILTIKNDADTGGGSKIVKNTYTIEGTIQVEETELKNDETITLTENGVYTITAYSYNEAGKRSEGATIIIKKDNTTPGAPKVEIISGTKAENTEWYVDDVILKVTQAEIADPLSKISKITYKIDGEKPVDETQIENEGTIQITSDGIHTITVYNYNEAGTCSEGTTIVVQRDSTAPNVSKVSAKDVTGGSFTLAGEGSDETSGVLTYEFYLNNELISTVNTNVKQVEIPVVDKTPGIYKAYIIVKDVAGHTKKSEEITIKTTELTLDEIDYVEFVVTGFSIKKGDEDVQDGVVATISDTSLTDNSKYIMVNSSSQNTKGTVTGKLRIVNKNGTVTEEFTYFPQELTLNMQYFADGSGTRFSHNNEANFFGIDLNPGKVQDGETVQTNIEMSNDSITENKFTISDEKLTGTQTYTRVTISSVMLNGEKVPFRIVQE